MPQISGLSFDVKLEPHLPTRLTVVDTTLSIPSGFVGIFKVVQPDGYVRSGDINTPDVDTVTRLKVIPIIADSTGNIQQGQYTVEFTGNAPGYLSTTFIRTFTFQYTPAAITLRNDFDLFTPELAYADISNYNISGYTITSGPTRNWDATSPTTGLISSTNSSIDIKFNNKYYAENYTIDFEVSVGYVHQTYPWLTVLHNMEKTVLVTACIPKSMEELTQAVEALRLESNESCGGDWARFEKANSLYVHLINMLRLVLIAGEQQAGFFDAYQQLLTYIQNGSVSCSSIGQEILPYDFSDYESSIYDGESSYCTLVGDNINTVYRVNHNLGDKCVVVQVYEVATGKQVFCDIAVATNNAIDITFYEPPTLNQYRVVAMVGAIGLRGEGLQPGGLAGEVLRKKSNIDFDTEWVAITPPEMVPYVGAIKDVDLGEFGLKAGNLEFDLTPTDAPVTAGSMSWNDSDGTVDLKLKGGNVTLQVGQEMVARVVNKTGADLLGSQYRAVRIRKVAEGGAQGQRLAVVLAQANTEYSSTDMMGVVTESISNNQEGFITTFGTVRGINTTGSLQGETWVDGDIIFLSPSSPGGLTKVEPTAPNHLIIVGYVEYAHANNGKLFIHVQTSWEIDELHNVAISNPQNNDILKYNSTTGVWYNTPAPTGGVTSVGLSTTTSGVTIGSTPVTSSGVITINIATATASTNGLLSSTDWTAFNSKVGGSGTINYIPKFTAAGTIGNSQIFDNGTNIGFKTTSPASVYHFDAPATGGGAIFSRQLFNYATVSQLGSSADAIFGGGIIADSTNGQLRKLVDNDAHYMKIQLGDGISFHTGITGSANSTHARNNNIRMQIFPNGNISVNAGADAGYKLDVAGTLRNTTGANFATTSGNVGISTTTPQVKFVVSNFGLNGFEFDPANNFITGYNRTTSAWTPITFRASSYILNINNSNNAVSLKSTGNFLINTETDDGYRLDVNGNLRTVTGANFATSSGNVGIGTTTPIAKLDVNGTLSVGPAIKPASVLGLISITNQRFVGNDPQTYAATGTGIGQNILNGYYLGAVGTYNRVFDIAAIGTPDGTNGGGVIRFLTNPVTLDSPAVERMRITPVGNITIGTLSGTGTRMVVADASGTLSTQSISGGVVLGTGTTNRVAKFTGTSTIGDGGIVDERTAEAVRITSNGNVGVGITANNPLSSGGTFRNLMVGNGAGYAAFQGVSTATAAGSTLAAFMGGTSSASSSFKTAAFISVELDGESSTNATGRITFTVGQPAGAYLEAMRITSAGNVGIGVVPKAWQTVTGVQIGTAGSFASHRFSSGNNQTFMTNNLYYDNAGFKAINTDTVAMFRMVSNEFRWELGGTTSADVAASLIQPMTLTSVGNLGIGTTTPLYRLDVNSGTSAASFRTLSTNTTSNRVIYEATAGNVEQHFLYTGNQDWVLGLDKADSNKFKLSSADNAFASTKVTVTTAGDVGIGTTTPAGRLDVNSGEAVVSAYSTSLRLSQTGTQANSGQLISFFNSTQSWHQGAIGSLREAALNSFSLTFFTSVVGALSAERMRITSAGNVGIGTIAPAEKLDVNGNIQILNNGYIKGSTYIATRITIDNSLVLQANSAILFNINGGTEAARITNTGNFLVGTAVDSGFKVDVTSDIRVNGLRLGRGLKNDASNTAFGSSALNSTTTASSTTAIGNAALQFLTTGIRNTALGSDAAGLVTTGSQNTVVGMQSALNTTTGDNNISIGYVSMFENISGSGNVSVGTAAMYGLKTSFNVAVGQNAGRWVQPGTSVSADSVTNGIYLGFQSRAGSATATNEIVIGSEALGNGSNTVTLGNNSIVSTILKGNIGINTSTPTYKLHLPDSGGSTGVLNQAMIAGVVFGSDGNGQYIEPSGSRAFSIIGQGGNGKLFTGVFGGVGKWGINTTMVDASVLNLNGNMTIGLSYLGTAAPVNGMIIEGVVAIGASTAAASAKLEVASTTQGFLPPRMTSSQRTSISSPATGLVVYQTDGTEGLYVKTSTAWIML